MVYWQPPKQALEKAAELVWEPSVSRYGADEGLPELREALTKKVFTFFFWFEFNICVGAPGVGGIGSSTIGTVKWCLIYRATQWG